MRIFKGILLTSIVIFISCSNNFQNKKYQNSVVDLINSEHLRKLSMSKGSSFSTYDKRVYEIRQRALGLYEIKSDTTQVKQFIILDVVSFGGGNIDGKFIIDNSLYGYSGSPVLGSNVKKFDSQLLPGRTDEVVIQYLKEHKFRDLENLATNKGVMTSGSNFLYIGMYEKGMDSIYVNVLPAFVLDN